MGISVNFIGLKTDFNKALATPGYSCVSVWKRQFSCHKIGYREEIVKEGKVWKIRKNPVQLNVRVVYPAKKICDLVPSLPNFTMLPRRPDKHCGDLHNKHAPTHQRSVELIHTNIGALRSWIRDYVFFMKMYLEMYVNFLFPYLNVALKALLSWTFLVCNWSCWKFVLLDPLKIAGPVETCLAPWKLLWVIHRPLGISKCVGCTLGWVTGMWVG